MPLLISIQFVGNQGDKLYCAYVLHRVDVVRSATVTISSIVIDNIVYTCCYYLVPVNNKMR